MRVEAKPSTRPAAGRARSRPLLILGILAAGAVFAAYSAALILGGMLIFRSVQGGFTNGGPRMPLKVVPVHLLTAAKNHVAALRSNAEPLDLVHVDIKFKHLQKLRAKRDEAMAMGVLMASDGDFVPAKIRHDGRSLDVKLRLKGDMLDHLSGDKWSLRVKVRGGDQLFGMRRFSIQAPSVRDFQAEPIFLKHLRDNGILTPRYRFVNVSVNGKNIGAMAVEEHFSKELLESQERREGVILRFDESDFWRNLALNGTFGPFGNPHIAILTPFGSSKVAESPALQSDFATAVGLMRGFLAGDLAPDEVFEVELMARFMAICEVWRTSHPIAWHNMRFYFNPLTSRLEPVGFDGNIQGASHPPGLVTAEGGFTPMLLADAPFRERFTRELARIATEMGDGTIEAWARPIEAELVPQLQEGLGWIAPMRFDSLVPRAKKLASISRENFDLFLPPLGDPDMRFPDPIRIFLCEDCRNPRIEIVNNLPVPVQVHSMTFTRKTGVPASALEPTLRSTFPIEIPATKSMQIPTPVYLELESAADVASFEVEGVAQVNGQAQQHTLLARRYYAAIDASPLPEVTLEEALQTHEFLQTSDDKQSVFVSPGVWEVTAPLIIPRGLGLTLSAGTELRFPEGGILVSSGPLRFEGTADQPVRLAPIAGSESWGGLVSWRSDSPHLWRHVVIERTSGFSRVGWRLTGGVTLRRAEIEISDSLFIGNRSEDALNMIRSRFELVDVEFHDASSDALDADFSDGVIRRGRFVQIGGDGIDVSGAEIEVDGTILTDISDKAISVGEASQLTARNVEIERVGTGAASKDASELVFEDSTVKGATTAGVSVYTKKPVFGPAQARVERVQMENVAIPALVQAGSSATLDGVAVEEQPFDTDILY